MKRGRTKNGRKKAQDLKQEDIAALALFRHEVLRFLNFSKEAAEAVGLTMQQYQVMLFIEGFSGEEQINLRDLATKLFVTHHSAVELVNRMEAIELIRRCADERDKRCVRLQLTPQGMGKLRSLAAVHLETLSDSQLIERLQKVIS